MRPIETSGGSGVRHALDLGDLLADRALRRFDVVTVL